MSKFLFTSALIILTTSCITIEKSQPKQTRQEDPDYSQESDYPEAADFPVWGGPGWYGGIYINNENDYWNHYNRQGDHQGHEDRNGRGGSRGGGEHQGGGGHGGGGHR